MLDSLRHSHRHLPEIFLVATSIQIVLGLYEPGESALYLQEIKVHRRLWPLNLHYYLRGIGMGLRPSRGFVDKQRCGE